MKRSLLIAVVVLFGASMAFAQAGSIGLFADDAGTSCNVTAPLGGIFYVYMFHLNTTGATASLFMVEYPVGASYVADGVPPGTPYLIIGNSNAGISVAYSRCETGSFWIATATMIGAGAATCSYMSVVPHPNATSGEIEAVDCESYRMYPTGGQAVVNGDGTCDCAVPVNDKTWGGIKALYQ
jgi:hypothetical protein